MGDSYVQPGQQVSAGDVLGGMGAMGSLDATHVHFEAIGYCDALGSYVAQAGEGGDEGRRVMAAVDVTEATEVPPVPHQQVRALHLAQALVGGGPFQGVIPAVGGFFSSLLGYTRRFPLGSASGRTSGGGPPTRSWPRPGPCLS